MRLLTFMGMAVEYKEISFDTMEQELQIGADDVEAFVIDGTIVLIFFCVCVIIRYDAPYTSCNKQTTVLSFNSFCWCLFFSCSYQDGLLQN